MGNTSGKVKEQGWPCPALGLPPRRCWVPAAARPSVRPHGTAHGTGQAERRAPLFGCFAVLVRERCPFDGHEKFYTITFKQTPW